MEEVQVFNNEEFGEVRSMTINGEPWFVGKDIAIALGYSNSSKAVITHVDEDDKVTKTSPYSQNGNTVGKLTFINESGLYSLILSSKLPNAKKFKKWVTSEVLPALRKYGVYSMRESYMIENPVERALKWAEEERERQKLRLENKELTTEICHKEDVIVGLVDDIDLTEKRRRITQIIRYGTTQYRERYGLLYREFEMKYHLDLDRRMESKQCLSMKPKIKNKMDYIDRVMKKIPELYEIACKLFENDVQKLQDEIWSLNQ